uniref:Uncharacterized protein n=1 Tax=Nelumbo nucifera TaxID=4432 RepID=A0A822YUF8_NELNU|nr:TPA_asm: hypothetical protein HUJ06_011729 [Nelumbo nucifera]
MDKQKLLGQRLEFFNSIDVGIIQIVLKQVEEINIHNSQYDFIFSDIEETKE